MSSSNEEILKNDIVTKGRVRLNSFEDGAVKNGSNPISTITWCEGNHEKAALVLMDRLKQIVISNPWLVGSIVTREGKNYLEFDATTEELEEKSKSIFRHLTDKESFLSPKTAFGDVGRKCADANLMSRFTFDANRPLFQISVMPSTDNRDGENENFAIIVTMSHVVGDGDTYYSIYHMLMSGQNIVPLDPERIDHELKQQHEKLGEWECGLLNSGGFIMAAIRGVLSSKIFSVFSNSYRPTAKAILVDMDKIKVIKAEHEKEITNSEMLQPGFVSTNDIVTSWFLRNSSCQHGMMAINLRGRLENYRKEKAGNYENLIYYRIPDDCRSPDLIRRSLTTLRRVVTPTETPSTAAVAWGDFAIASSWASFPGSPFKIDNCQHLAHLPLYDFEGGPASISMCILFRYSPQQLGLLVSGTPNQLKCFQDVPFSKSQTIYHFQH